jgi:hypothetical protein
MECSRTVVNGVVSAVLMTAMSSVIVGCRDSSPLAPTAPQGVLRASVTGAPASSTEFDGFINFCVSDDPTRFKITPGETLHFTASNENRWVTGNPLIDGVERNTVAANINLKNGQGVVHLDVSLKPDAVNGTWEIKQQLSLPERVSSGVGHGTGDLQGMTIKFTTSPGGGTSVCNPDMPAAPVQGVILSPAS